MSEQLAEFELAQGGALKVVVEPKARYGKGGLLDLLRTAQPVAPSILPDLISLDVGELETAANLGLLQPLDDLVTGDAVDHLYPWARTAGRFEDRQLALQYIADIDHVVYRSALVTSPPATWDQLLSADISYLLPLGDTGSSGGIAANPEVQGIVVSQYLSAGGMLDNVTRQLTLAPQPLYQMLVFYEAARDRGLLPPAALELTNTEAVWAVFTQGRTPLAQVSATRFLADQDDVQGSAFAPMPGHVGPATPVTRGWALAIVTPDPERRKAAAALLSWLLRPENAGPLTQAVGWLPTSSLAWVERNADAYSEFLAGQLAQAVSPPIGQESLQTAARLHKAIISVVRRESTAIEAVDAAVNPAR